MKKLISLIKSKFGGLKQGFEKLPAVSEPVKTTPIPVGDVWVVGRKGQDVKELQKKLINLGYELSGGSDGHLGPYTAEVLEDFKRDQDILEVGIGPKTRDAVAQKYENLHIPAGLVLKVGDDDDDFKDDGDPSNDTQVQDYQKKLILLGYPHPRFGADGDFGEESLDATRMFQDDHKKACGDENANRDQGVGPKTYLAVMTAKPIPLPPVVKPKPGKLLTLPFDPPEMVITKDNHELKKGSGTRPISMLKGVTLHQTATVLGENPERWDNVACHFAITRSGKIIYVNDITKRVSHGNGFNSYTVGIEIDGHFAGLESLNDKGEWVIDEKTYWRPKKLPNRVPLSVTQAQADACKALIRWLKRYVDGNGGLFEYVLAHRQSSIMRISDPGQKCWQLIAVPLLEEGFKDGGPDFYILDHTGRAGYPLCEDWDPKRHAGVKYKPKTSTKGRKKVGP